MDSSSTSTSPSLPRCAVVRYHREGGKVHWIPCNTTTTSSVAARVRDFDNAFELEQYSSRAVGIPLKSITNSRLTQIHDTVSSPTLQTPTSPSKPPRFPWRNWRKTQRKCKSGRFYNEDLDSTCSVPTRLRTAPSDYESQDSRRKLGARHSVHATPWCNGAYLNCGASGLSAHSSPPGFGDLRSSFLSYTQSPEEEEKHSLKKNSTRKSARWISQLRKRLVKRRTKSCEFDDRIGVFSVDSYY